MLRTRLVRAEKRIKFGHGRQGTVTEIDRLFLKEKIAIKLGACEVYQLEKDREHRQKHLQAKAILEQGGEVGPELEPWLNLKSRCPGSGLKKAEDKVVPPDVIACWLATIKWHRGPPHEKHKHHNTEIGPMNYNEEQFYWNDDGEETCMLSVIKLLSEIEVSF